MYLTGRSLTTPAKIRARGLVSAGREGWQELRGPPRPEHFTPGHCGPSFCTLHPQPAGSCHPPFTPAYLPACSRSLWGSVDPGCGSPCREKCSRRLWSPEGVYQACCSSIPTGCAITSCLGLPGSDPCWAEKVSAKGICALAPCEAAEVY